MTPMIESHDSSPPPSHLTLLLYLQMRHVLEAAGPLGPPAFSLANAAMLRRVRNREILGKPVDEPSELWAARQHILRTLKEMGYPGR